MEVTRITVGDLELVITTENSRMYRFRNKPQVDHLFYDGDDRTCYIFEADQLFQMFELVGSILIDNDPPEHDVEAFIRYQNQQLELDLEKLA